MNAPNVSFWHIWGRGTRNPLNLSRLLLPQHLGPFRFFIFFCYYIVIITAVVYLFYVCYLYCYNITYTVTSVLWYEVTHVTFVTELNKSSSACIIQLSIGLLSWLLLLIYCQCLSSCQTELGPPVTIWFKSWYALSFYVYLDMPC